MDISAIGPKKLKQLPASCALEIHDVMPNF